MKEVLTKSFWQGVRRTFYDALEAPPAAEDCEQNPTSGRNASPSPDPPPFADETETNARPGSEQDKFRGVVEEQVGQGINDLDLAGEASAEKAGGKVQKKLSDVEKAFEK